MTLFSPMRALTVIAELGLNALATVLDPGPGVSADYLRAAVGADELADAEAEQEVAEPVGEHESATWVEAFAAGYVPPASRPRLPNARAEHLGPYEMADPFPGPGGVTVADPNGASWTLDELFKAQRRVEGDRWGEPPLSGSELVGVRQLLEERFGDSLGVFVPPKLGVGVVDGYQTPPADGAAGDPGPAAGDGPAAGIQTGNVAPAAGQLSLRDRIRRAVTSHIGNSFGSGEEIADDIYFELTAGETGLSRDELMDLARAAWSYSENAGSCDRAHWHSLATRTELIAEITAPN